MSDTAKLTGYPDHKTVQMAIILENAAGHDTTADILSILRERLATADATVAALTAENERLKAALENIKGAARALLDPAEWRDGYVQVYPAAKAHAILAIIAAHEAAAPDQAEGPQPDELARLRAREIL